MSAASGSFAVQVIRWQRQHGRSTLPWQNTRDPYRVWLSEIMLQQTQVSTVMGYYARFLARFPTVADLAEAPSEVVMALWSGLGYYARARNLHACAQAVARDHGGQFPGSAAGLAELPGIGRSTSAAIAAFCYGERVAILDGNVKRVLTRVLAYEGDLSSAAAERRLWEVAEAMLPAPGDVGPAAAIAEDMISYTQGVMDLGATLCATRNPACDACPVNALCAARRRGDVERFPVKTRKLKRGRRAHALLWVQRGDRVWLTLRGDSGVWAQLWSLPEFETAALLEARVAAWPGALEWLPPFEHVLTHFDWALQPVRLVLPEDVSEDVIAAIEALAPAAEKGRWVARDALPALGLPAPIRKLFDGAGGPPPA